jgi:hypothetical protein
MAEAPKIPQIVRERLRVQQAGRPGQEHPDADMLAAFSENTLASGERSLVTSHLSVCSSCREIVILSQPSAEAAALAGGRGARAPGWMAFRWAALTACLVLTVGVVFFERTMRQQGPASPAPVATAPAASTLKDEQLKAEPASPDAKLETRNQKPALAAKTRAEKLLPLNERAFGAPAGYASFQSNSMGGRASGDGGARSAERTKSHAATNETAPAREENSYRANKAPAAPPVAVDHIGNFSTFPPPAAYGGVIAGTVTGTNASAGSRNRERQLGSMARLSPGVSATSVEGEADEASEAELAKQAPGKKKVADETLPMATTAAAARRPLPRDDKSAVAQSLAMSASTSSSNFKFEAKDQQEVLTSDADKLATASLTPMQWRIRGGKLQHSTDSGKTWQEVNIPTAASLRAFWSLGNTVWAGGTQGSLFQVTEAGKNSVQIPIRMNDGNVSQTVVAISFSDEMHGIITLENGQILQTADGGKTWQRH